jgi:hypothetical protein
MISQVVIMAVPERSEAANALSRELAADAIVIDEKRCGPLFNLCQALRLPPRGPGWRLIVQDDVEPVPDVIPKLDHILEVVPRATFVTAYCPQNNGYEIAWGSGANVLRTRTNFWGQAILWPEVQIPRFLTFRDAKVRPDYRHDDRALAAFLRETRGHLLALLPSFFQHRGAWSSTMGTPGVVGGRERISGLFQPDFDPLSISWGDAIANAARNEVSIDFRKVLRDE